MQDLIDIIERGFDSGGKMANDEELQYPLSVVGASLGAPRKDRVGGQIPASAIRTSPKSGLLCALQYKVEKMEG